MLVSPQHTFGTDAVLLAHFAAPRPRERWADLGTGCGVIPLLWRVRTQAGAITGVEMQEKAAWQAQRSVEENGFSATVDIVQGDARQLAGTVPGGEPRRHRLQPALHRAGSGHSQRGWRPPRRPPGGQPLLGGSGPGGQVRPAVWGQALPVLAAPAAGRRPWRCSTATSWSPSGCGCAAAGGESALFVFAGVPPGRQARAWTVGPVLLLEREDGSPTQEIEAIYGDYRDNPEHRKQ